MDKLSKQFIDKPKHLQKYDLIAIIGIYDVPLEVQDPMKSLYIKSEIAFNEATGKVQVYITSDKPAGLEKFKKDYPNAEIRETAALNSPDEWRVSAFPTEGLPDESTALDNYFLVRGKELSELLREENIRKRGK